MNYKKISVEFLLDEDTQEKLRAVYEDYKSKYETTMTQEAFFQMLMTEGSLRLMNEKLEAYAFILKERN